MSWKICSPFPQTKVLIPLYQGPEGCHAFRESSPRVNATPVSEGCPWRSLAFSADARSRASHQSKVFPLLAQQAVALQKTWLPPAGFMRAAALHAATIKASAACKKACEDSDSRVFLRLHFIIHSWQKYTQVTKKTKQKKAVSRVKFDPAVSPNNPSCPSLSSSSPILHPQQLLFLVSVVSDRAASHCRSCWETNVLMERKTSSFLRPDEKHEEKTALSCYRNEFDHEISKVQKIWTTIAPHVLNAQRTHSSCWRLK